jgi:hypothetical protein
LFPLPLVSTCKHRLLKNESARLLWHTYIDAEAVAVPTFLLAVRSFLQEHLRLPAPEVEEVLNKDNTDALVTSVDRDGDGRVRTSAAVSCMPPVRRKADMGSVA